MGRRIGGIDQRAGEAMRSLGITRARDNGCDLIRAAGTLWIGDDGYPARRIVATPRMGIVKAADKPLRYLLGGNRFVSGVKLPSR